MLVIFVFPFFGRKTKQCFPNVGFPFFFLSLVMGKCSIKMNVFLVLKIKKNEIKNEFFAYYLSTPFLAWASFFGTAISDPAQRVQLFNGFFWKASNQKLRPFGSSKKNNENFSITVCLLGSIKRELWPLLVYFEIFHIFWNSRFSRFSGSNLASARKKSEKGQVVHE